jgi:hypothetical protein
MDVERGPVTFIVRLTPGAGGVLQGVVERVRTGEKSRFESLDGLGSILADAVSQERGPKAAPRLGPRRTPPGPR